MSRTRLILLPAAAAEPAPWLVFDASGHVLERGQAGLEAPLDGPALPTVAIVPGAEVLVRWVETAGGAPAQRRAAALWALKDDLATPVERLRLALGPAESDGRACAAVVGDALLAAWIDWLTAVGAPATSLVPDCLAVPEPGVEEVLSAVGFGPTLALRGRRFAASVDPDLAELVAAGRRIEPVADAGEIERMLIAAGQRPPIDLREALRGGTERGWRGWRLAAALAAALAVSPVLLDLAAAVRDETAAAGARRATDAAAARVFPELAGTDAPGAAAAARLRTTPPGGAAVAAAALFAAVEAVEGAEVDSYSADPEAGVRATVSYPAYQDLDALKAGVAARGLTLTDASTLDENGRVVSDLIVEAGR